MGMTHIYKTELTAHQGAGLTTFQIFTTTQRPQF